MLRDRGHPLFHFPGNAARALGRGVAWHAEERRPRPARRARFGKPARPGLRSGGHCQPGPGHRARDGWLAPADAEALLGAYGVVVPRSVLVRTPDEAGGRQLSGCPVVVKVAAAVHKTDVGGVVVGGDDPGGGGPGSPGHAGRPGSAGMAELAGEFLVQEQVGGGPRDDRRVQPRPVARANGRRWSRRPARRGAR